VARVTYVAAVIGNLEHFVGEVLNLKCPRESVPAAKFLIASEPAAYRGFRRHPGVLTDGPKTFTVEEPKADRHSNLGIITGQTAPLGGLLMCTVAIKGPDVTLLVSSSGVRPHPRPKTRPDRSRGVSARGLVPRRPSPPSSHFRLPPARHH